MKTNKISLNLKLHKAKAAKDDEFYTLYETVANELDQYPIEIFRGKRIYLNCDNPFKSNFWRYLEDNREKLQFAQVISTYFTPGNTSSIKTILKADGLIEVETIAGDGSFSSPACVEILKNETDLLITNPPFSIFREFFKLITSVEKEGLEYIFIGSSNVVVVRCAINSIVDKKLFKGLLPAPMKFLRPDGSLKQVNACFFTSLNLHKMGLKNKKQIELDSLVKYDPAIHEPLDDRPDIISIPSINQIPGDYPGLMAISTYYFERHNPDLFEILGKLRPSFKGKFLFQRLIIRRIQE